MSLALGTPTRSSWARGVLAGSRHCSAASRTNCCTSRSDPWSSSRRPPWKLPYSALLTRRVVYVLERNDFDSLFDALARRGYTIVGPTVRDRGDRLRRDPLLGGAADRLDGRAGRRAITGCGAATTRRCSATRSDRTRGSSTSCRPRSSCGARASMRTGRCSDVTEPPRDSSPLRVLRRPLVRAARDRNSGPGAARRLAPRPGRRRAYRGPVRRRGPVRAGGRHVLLRLDEHRPRRRARLRPRADRGARAGRHYFVVEVGSELGAEVLAEVPARRCGRAGDGRRRRRPCAHRRRRWAASST